MRQGFGAPPLQKIDPKGIPNSPSLPEPSVCPLNLSLSRDLLWPIKGDRGDAIRVLSSGPRGGVCLCLFPLGWSDSMRASPGWPAGRCEDRGGLSRPR